MRQQKEEEAELRSQEAAARARSQQEHAAKQRFHQEREIEADARMRNAAALARAEDEQQHEKRQNKERVAEEQWEFAIQNARAVDEEKLAQDARERERKEKEASNVWRQGQYRKAQRGDESQPASGQFREVHGSANQQQQEAEAAQRTIRELMEIRGERKEDVLKNVALITVEAIDAELQGRCANRKRKLQPDDPARLPTLITELFVNLESSGDSSERFRFGKKRRLGSVESESAREKE